MTNTREENAADLASEEKPGIEQLADWKYEVAKGDTVLGLAEWIAHQADTPTASDGQPPPKSFRVEGQIYLAEGFSVVFQAVDAAHAERQARAWASTAEWKYPECQEVCVQSTTEQV